MMKNQFFPAQMVQDLKKENFDLKLRLYMEQKENEVRYEMFCHLTDNLTRLMIQMELGIDK